MKKRIFISIHYMEIGGAEMSLIGLLHAIDYSRYDVDLFICSHRGELMQFIPREVNVLPEIPEYACIEKPIAEIVRQRLWKMAYARLKAKILYYIQKKNKHDGPSEEIFGIIANCVTPYLPSLKHYGLYDLAINYIGISEIVLEKVESKKKICWLHTDYTTVKVNSSKGLPVFSALDHIISISSDVTRAFLNTYPSLENKIVEIENILSLDFVGQRAELIPPTEIDKEMPYEENVIRLLSIGRFCYQKNFENVPDICQKINSKFKIQNSKLRVKWFLIGFGGDEELIRRKIEEAGMQDHVIILGKKSNPYPYIKACDIYVQPSRFEGKSITVREAQMLCKPVVITNYLTAPSQVTDGNDGVIVPLDNEGCAMGLCDFIQNMELQESISEFLSKNDFAKTEDINKLYDLME